MFRITGNKGFNMTFDNGYTVSVQFGAGNYSDNYDLNYLDAKDGVPPSKLAEFAAWDGERNFIEVEGKYIHDYIDVNEALRLINIVSSAECSKG